ncbi:hypothetical protein Q3G72_027679 [Acer saccharum]|nr:hypothetical protein Q3G72_027679 [Acer saccharum]
MVDCKNQLTSDEMELVCAAIWRIWFMRNGTVHNSKVVQVVNIVPWEKAFLVDFRKANDVDNPVADICCLASNSWRPPDMGSFKANSDAVVDLLHGKLNLLFKAQSYHQFVRNEIEEV